ncbi:MAG: c-type cytochrome, partial [Polyangiaceae bacterium]
CHGGNATATDTSAHDCLFALKKKEGMLSDVALTEAACGRCHATEKHLRTTDGLELAPHLAKGRATFEAQCAACHDPDASHTRAPSASWLASTVTPAALMATLAAPPKAMPKLFAQHDAPMAARKNLVAWLTSLTPPSDLRGAANVTGANAEEGKSMFTAFGCTACHAAGFGDFPARNSEDFIALYIQHPKRIFSGAKMPSLRLTKREAASLAKYVATLSPVALLANADADEASAPAFQNAHAKCDEANGEDLTHVACGKWTAAKLGCDSCHASETHPADHTALAQASDLARWGTTPPTLDRLRDAAMGLVSPKHPQIQIETADTSDLLVALASNMDAHVTADFDPTRAPYFEAVRGAELLEDRGCLSCHTRATKELRMIGSGLSARSQVSSLFAEGARVQPEWLLAFLRDPEANGVRVALHPEWIWGELIPIDKMAVRMPSYGLSTADTTAIARTLALQDHGDFPYANVRTPSLTSAEILSAEIHVNSSADNGGDCLRCHYVGALPIDRAKKDLDALAPNLGKISARLRPWFVADLLSRPQDFVEGMPALWPDADGAALVWTLPSDAKPLEKASDQIALVRDFLFLLRAETRLQRPGDELRTPIFGLAAP